MAMDDDDLKRMNRVLRHRLRNLASGMRNAVALLGHELDARLTPAEREYFPLLRQECDGLRNITDRMNLLFDDLASGGELGLREAVAAVVDEVRREHPAIRLSLLDSAMWDTARVGAGQWFRTVIHEVLTNAAQAAPQGAVRISVARNDDGRLVVLARDDGPGMPPETRAQAFWPFFTTRPRHLGLGLAIARRWADRQGGTVYLAPPDDEPGTGFGIVWPNAS